MVAIGYAEEEKQLLLLFGCHRQENLQLKI